MPVPEINEHIKSLIRLGKIKVPPFCAGSTRPALGMEHVLDMAKAIRSDKWSKQWRTIQETNSVSMIVPTASFGGKIKRRLLPRLHQKAFREALGIYNSDGEIGLSDPKTDTDAFWTAMNVQYLGEQYVKAETEKARGIPGVDLQVVKKGALRQLSMDIQDKLEPAKRKRRSDRVRYGSPNLGDD